MCHNNIQCTCTMSATVCTGIMQFVSESDWHVNTIALTIYIDIAPITHLMLAC